MLCLVTHALLDVTRCVEDFAALKATFIELLLFVYFATLGLQGAVQGLKVLDFVRVMLGSLTLGTQVRDSLSVMGVGTVLVSRGLVIPDIVVVSELHVGVIVGYFAIVRGNVYALT